MPRIQHKRGTAANLASVNPTPLAGELVWDSTENAIKVGDGATAWASLAYVTATPRSHNHDDRYYTETEVDGFLDGKSDTGHNHGLSSLSDVSAAAPISDKAFLVYNSSLSQWVASTGIGQVGVGAQPLGGWPAGSVGASLAGKVDTSDARLTDARTPTAHKASHATGGSDALSPSDIGAAPAASPVFSGNVGIGFNPAGSFNAAFDDLVVGTGSGQRGITVYTDSSSAATLAFADATSGVATYAGYVQYLHSTDELRLATNSTARVYIDSTGKVGIGRTVPASALDVNGVITVSAGTAAAPAIVASGDPNSGLLWPAADTVALSTAGVERLRVGSAGTIGLGGANASNVGLYHRYTLSSASTRYGEFIQPTVAASSSSAVLLSTAGVIMEDNASVTTLVCYQPANTVLGTGASIANQYGFFIGSGFTQATNNYGFFGGLNAGAGRWNIYSGGTADNYFAGNVGIGASRTSPSSALDVNGVITVAATSGSAGSFLPSLTISGDPNTGFGQVSGQSDTASIFTAGSERVRVDANGNVGIGVSVDASFANGYRNLVVGNGGGTRGMTIYANPANAATIAFADGTSGAASFAGFINYLHADDAFSIGTNATARVRISSAGHVGLLTDAPTAALDINADKIRLRTAKTPASASDTGNAGDICWDANFVYVCTATNTWRKAALTADGTQTIANDSVTYAKIQNVSATDRLLGRSSAGAGDIEEITCTAFGRSLIDDANAAAARGTLGAAPTENATFTGTTTFNGPVVESRVVGGNTGTAKTISLTNGTLQDYTLTGNCTFTLPGVAVGQSFTLLLRTGTGGYTATFTGVKWPGNSPPTVTTAANQLDIFTFVSDGGNWFGNFAKGYVP